MTGTRGRYAPSPTGEVHLGNASTALLAWLSARSQGGAFVMRLEDLDGPRVRPGAAERIAEDLRWLGLDWDEGYDVGGPYAPYVQSARFDRYRDALERLRSSGHVYPCFCSRKDVAAAASAPQQPGDETPYPGTCRDRADAPPGRRPAWRFRMASEAASAFDDAVFGRFVAPLPTDFVVWRNDGTPAYQLAVVVDDAAMRITEVVRGEDLLVSTLRQLALYRALGFAAPRFAHAPLLLGADGVRLSKRHDGTTLAALRDAGWRPEAVVGRLAAWLGLRPEPTPTPARSLIADFDLRRVKKGPGPFF
ncbi:MAG TPA: tRNA glutamyl-Q(34) synthetase GluQRS [Candidatus Polarisedimenticolaceae bacterium]